MNRYQSRYNDELAVLVSLAAALGMVVGAVAAMWIWSAGVDRIESRQIESRMVSLTLVPESNSRADSEWETLRLRSVTLGSSR